MNYSPEELGKIGFGAVGRNVIIHKSAQIFSPQDIYIGNNVRIDCFSVLSAGKEGIHIGNNVHLAVSVLIFGGGGRVTLEDFSGLSSRVSVYTATDDYSGGYLTNPTVPDRFKNVMCGPVTFRKHVVVGSGSVVMPNVELGLGASVGALSYVRKCVESFAVMSGNPMKLVGRRDEKVLEMERLYLESETECP